MTIALWQSPLARVVQGIVKAGNGCWLDPSDMSTMFQDAAGTTPVTAVEQPVGLILDKSGNGNHATQSVTASRPVLSARYNLLTKTEDFSDAVWITSTEGTSVIAPSKNNIRESGGGVVMHRVRYLYANVVIGVPHTFSFKFKPAGLRYCAIRGSGIGGNTQIGFDLQTKAVTFASAGRSGEVTYEGDGYVIISCSFSPVATSITESLTFSTTQIIDDTLPQHVADITRGVDDLRASLTQSNARLPYQRVNTSTDYDTNPAYFPKYLKWDAVDDYLNLPFMNLYGGGAASIIAARDAVSQATDTYIISERSTSSANPKYFPSRQLAGGGNMDSYISDDTAAVVLDTTGSAFSGASDKVIRSVVDTGNNIKLFKNGSLAADDNYTRAGTLTLNNTTIGASVSTTTSNYASMKLYGLIITKSALTDAQRRACERHLSRKAGVAL